MLVMRTEFFIVCLPFNHCLLFRSFILSSSFAFQEAERVDTTEAKPSTEVSEERPSTSAYSEMTKTTTNTVDTVMVESEPPCISAASPGFKVIERTLVSPSSCSRNLEFDDKNYCNEENRHHEVEKVEVTNEIDNEDSESQGMIHSSIFCCSVAFWGARRAKINRYHFSSDLTARTFKIEKFFTSFMMKKH